MTKATNGVPYANEPGDSGNCHGLRPWAQGPNAASWLLSPQSLLAAPSGTQSLSQSVAPQIKSTPETSHNCTVQRT